MLSQLLRQETVSPVQQHQQDPHQSQPQPSPHPRSPPTTTTTTVMAASAATVAPVGLPMPTADDNRPDLPRPYKCPLCDKAFHRLEHQTRHIRTHTGEKPHACQFPGCTKRFSRSDELTRHSRIHSNPNSRRGNKQHVAAAHAAAAAIQGGLYEQQINHVNPMNHMASSLSQSAPHNIQNSPLPSLNHVTASSPIMTTPAMHMPLSMPMAMPPPPAPMSQASQSAPGSQATSPNVSPPHSYATYSGYSGSYSTRNTSGDLSPAQGNIHRPMDISLLATAASQVERENNNLSYIPNHNLSLPSRQYYHSSPYHTGRMPSLSSYHYSSNPTSQPMSRSVSDEEAYGGRASKKSKPCTPQSTAPPSPEFPHESTSPTPDHTPLATPSHSPRLRPQFFHNGVQLPGLNHLSLQNQPPPALAPVEPSADGHQPYIPAHHSGLRISEIMEAGDGSQRKLPVPMLATKESSFTRISDLVHHHHPDSGTSSGRISEAGNDLAERY